MKRFLEYLLEGKSAGIDSEYALVNKINEIIKEKKQPITIIFKSEDSNGLQEYICKDIIQAEQCGKEGSVRSIGDKGNKKSANIKADVRLVTTTGNKYPISLKKRGAVWIGNASVDGHDWYKPMLKKAVDTGITNIILRNGLDESYVNYKLTHEFYWEMTNEQKELALFGSDITKDGIKYKKLLPGCVIEETFNNSTKITEIQNGVYEISVKYMIQELHHAIGNHDLVWIVVNHRDRPGAIITADDKININGTQLTGDEKIKLYGIYVRAAFRSRISLKVKELKI